MSNLNTLDAAYTHLPSSRRIVVVADEVTARTVFFFNEL